MGPNYVLDKGYRAATALSPWRAVRQTAKDEVSAGSTAGETVIGFSQVTVAAADAGKQIADIRMAGITRAEIGAAVAIGDRLTVDNVGRVVPLAATTANQNQCGVALTAAGTAGLVVDMFITPFVRAST